MFILFQVPIADLRTLIDSDNYRLKLPSWNSPRTKSLKTPRRTKSLKTPRRTKCLNKEQETEDFIRWFGATKKRFQGGLKDWVGEDYYCLAERGIRFEQSFPKKTFGFKEKRIRLDCTFRRFFCPYENRIVSRVELGFSRAEGWNSSSNEPIANSCPTKLNAVDILEIVKDILDINIYIHAFDDDHKKREEAKKCALQRSGEFLAKEYLHLTTSHQGLLNSEIEMKSWWVTNGTPMLLIELPKDNLGSDSCSSKDNEGFKYQITQSSLEDIEATKIEATDIEGIEVWHFRAMPINVWMLLYDSSIMNDLSKKAKLREIRLHLSRLHAEWECLKIAFHKIITGEIRTTRGEPMSQVLQDYLTDSYKRLSKPERYGISQGRIIEELIKYDPQNVNGNLLISVKQKLENFGIRPDGLKKAEIFNCLYTT